MRREQFEQTSACDARHWWFVARREMLRAVAQQVVPASEDSLIVDVGCCTGANSAALAEDYNVVGIDTSAEAIGLARERFPEVSFIRGKAPNDMEDLTARADLVLLADVLEHVENDREMLARLSAAARPGAHFLITVPAEMALWSPHDVSHGHYRRYSCESFEAIWSGLPLATVGVTAFNSRLYPLVRLARLWSHLRGRAWGAANTDLTMPPVWLNRLLQRIFAGETARVVRAAGGDKRAAYRRGVSLLAVLRRVEDALPFAEREAYTSADGRRSLPATLSQGALACRNSIVLR